ncbi:proteasome alpha subunit [Actinoalloteichus hoggarensis]|uniref:Proteasome subunit alpha n=1 Tax=Actinoalloteichus hoggarensis TaxID=1470176 RepID=A0A221W2Q5_9PSEU|nr:proteasome subunit alpha [Actinoalloteichus hoggarensis]ASO20078.1 Proteasome subunit alpha 2 [Actinoalloteichus hoggarensis]MBB5919211.1 proteasome alpha subunit [Actinoalloteichus hoggarensis]
MSMPFYASPEQLMRERSELARKGIAKGRSAIVLTYAGGVLFVAENPSKTLHKVSEIYDRIGFAAAGRYPEFENLRVAGIRHADLTGYAYDRRDVSGRSLASFYAKTLGAIFTEQIKPYEVEICVAEVGAAPELDQLYHLTYDGSIIEEPGFVVMGGQAETISNALRDSEHGGSSLAEALRGAVRALAAESTAAKGTTNRPTGTKSETGKPAVGQLEVAVLERDRPHRAFRRVPPSAVAEMLGEQPDGAGTQAGAASAGETSDSATDSDPSPEGRQPE